MNKELQVLECGVDGEMGNEKINTTIRINKELWNEFSSIVAKKHGNRFISTILEDMIKTYVKKNGGMQK